MEITLIAFIALILTPIVSWFINKLKSLPTEIWAASISISTTSFGFLNKYKKTNEINEDFIFIIIFYILIMTTLSLVSLGVYIYYKNNKPTELMTKICYPISLLLTMITFVISILHITNIDNIYKNDYLHDIIPSLNVKITDIIICTSIFLCPLHSNMVHK